MAPRKKPEGGTTKQKRPRRPASEKQRAHLEKQREKINSPEFRASLWPDRLGGHPSKYKDEYAHIARIMCENGARDSELADAFGITTQTIWDWQSRHKEFGVALKIGKDEYDDRVERALAQRAIGYSYDTEKVFMPPGAKEAVRVQIREHIPPDPVAAFKWLTCRRMKKWRDRMELTGADGEPLMPIVALLREVNGATASLVDRRTDSEEKSCSPVLGQDVEA